MDDLIDRQKLLKKKQYSFQTEYGAFPRHDYFIKISDIKSMSAVDMQQHAHWIVVGGDLGYVDCKCSACGYTGCSDSALFDESELYNYCPNCGCKMDEVTNNDE